MNARTDLCYEGDLEYIDRQFKKFLKEKPHFFECLDCLLDIATLLPVCEYEYKANEEKFIPYDSIYDSLNAVIDYMEDYDIKISLSELLKSKLSNLRIRGN